MDPNTDLLKIAGIDTSLGLKRIGGKRDRYESLLQKFAKQQAEAAEVIRSALSAGDTSTAERGAHSLKGAASTLGATVLADDAAKTEAAIKAGHGVDEALRTLSISLDKTVEAIWTALPKEDASSDADRTSPDPATVLEPLTRLKQLLESNDGEATDFLVGMKTRLSGVLTPREVKTLAQHVDSFDFDAALRCLSGIAARLSLSLENK